jgi:hypothetical protein
MNWGSKYFNRAIRVTDLNVFPAIKMKFHLIVLKSVNLNESKNYIKAINKCYLIDLLLFEVIKDSSIRKFLF